MRVQRPIDSGDDTLASLLICTVKEDKTKNEQQLLALEEVELIEWQTAHSPDDKTKGTSLLPVSFSVDSLFFGQL